MIAIDYFRSNGERATDLFCAECVKDAELMADYAGDVSRPAMFKDASDDERNREAIACDGCGAEEELP